MQKILKAKIDGRQMDNSEIINAILKNRNINDILSFLMPTEDDLVPFEEMLGIEDAANIIIDAINNNDTFLIYYDTDLDGTCAGSIAHRYLKNYTDNIRTYIPEGKKHGLDGFPLDMLNGVNVLWIVDSINDDPDLYQAILDMGVKIVVTDHHIVPKKLIDSNVQINLVSSANYYPNPSLTGAGVTWKLCNLIDYLTLNNYSEKLYDLCCAGIIGDVGSMESKENRYLCYQGFNRLTNHTLKKMIGSYEFDSQSVQFSIAPAVNALVRMNDNNVAMKIFTTDDEDEINMFIKRAKEAKEGQNEIINSLIDELIEQGEAQIDKKCKVFWIPEEYRNLTGLLGNKLVNIYQTPVLVLHLNENDKDLVSGSMRATGLQDMAALINETGLAVAKGHELASGFETTVDSFNDFLEAIEKKLSDVEFSVCVEADIELEPSQINDALIKQLVAFNRISGADCPPIKVLVRTNDYEVSTFSTKKHLKIIDNETGLLIVKWNCNDWETMDNDGEIVAVGTLSSPVYGKKHFTQLTIDEYTQQNE